MKTHSIILLVALAVILPTSQARADAPISALFPRGDDAQVLLENLISGSDTDGDGHYSQAELLKLFESLKEQRNAILESHHAGAPVRDQGLPRTSHSRSIEEGIALMMERLDRDRDDQLTRKQVELGLKMMLRRF